MCVEDELLDFEVVNPREIPGVFPLKPQEFICDGGSGEYGHRFFVGAIQPIGVPASVAASRPRVPFLLVIFRLTNAAVKADRLDVSQGLVAQWETGRARPTEEMCRRLHEFFGERICGTFGEWVQAEREAKEWSQGELAAGAGLAELTIHYIGTGDAPCRSCGRRKTGATPPFRAKCGTNRAFWLTGPGSAFRVAPVAASPRQFIPAGRLPTRPLDWRPRGAVLAGGLITPTSRSAGAFRGHSVAWTTGRVGVGARRRGASVGAPSRPGRPSRYPTPRSVKR